MKPLHFLLFLAIATTSVSAQVIKLEYPSENLGYYDYNRKPENVFKTEKSFYYYGYEWEYSSKFTSGYPVEEIIATLRIPDNFDTLYYQIDLDQRVFKFNNIILKGFSREDVGVELFSFNEETQEVNLIADLNPGIKGSYPFNFTQIDSFAYFWTCTQIQHNRYAYSLWRTDGTTEGTSKILDKPNTYIQDFYSHFKNSVNVDNKIYYYLTNVSNNGELWMYDPISNETNLQYELSSYPYEAELTKFGRNILIQHAKSVFALIGSELYRVNYQGENLEHINNLFVVEADIYFTENGNIYKLSSNNSEPKLLFQGNHYQIINIINVLEDRIYFVQGSHYSNPDLKGGIISVNVNTSNTDTKFLYELVNVNFYRLNIQSVRAHNKLFSIISGSLYQISADGVIPFNSILPPADQIQAIKSLFTFKGNVYFLGRTQSHEGLFSITSAKHTAGGLTFYDTNQNGILDDGEQPLRNIQVSSNSNNQISYSDNLGRWLFSYPEAGTYEVNFTSDNYRATTTLPLTINLPEDSEKTFAIGLYPIEAEHNVHITFPNSRARCGFPEYLPLNLRNAGTTLLENFQVELTFDERTELISANNSGQADENSVTWSSTQALYPSHNRYYSLNLQMPGVDFMGDTLQHIARIYDAEDNLLATDTLRQVITCSYDPNDKLVKPAGILAENYTLKNSWLNYTIRFQNTGTDTAYNVLLVDTLDTNLNLGTLEILGSSHPMQASRKDRRMEFSFPDILLPDSNRNEPASHGYVHYRIKATAPVAENTRVENTAYIFFDFNPAIITNTTLNTLVTTLPQQRPTGLPAELNPLKLYPNPARTVINLPNRNYQHIKLYNAAGHAVPVSTIEHGPSTIRVPIQHLKPGLYFMQVNEGGKVLRQKFVVTR